jgi:hypothetical protein
MPRLPSARFRARVSSTQISASSFMLVIIGFLSRTDRFYGYAVYPPPPSRPPFLQLPVSAVNSTPLPFLNRLEKYTLSLDVALAERLALLAFSARDTHAAASRQRRPCEDPELWSAVRDGVSNFADAMVAETALPGFVPRETIAALLMRAMDDSLAHPDGAVVIRPAVHAVSSLTAAAETREPAAAAAALSPAASDVLPPEPDDDDDDVRQTAAQDDDGASDDDDEASAAEAEAAADAMAATPAVFPLPRQRLRAIIRLINYQLLQLARPECVCSGSGSGSRDRQEAQLGLPEPYLREYVQRQDHFSAANLIRAQVTTHWLHVPTGGFAGLGGGPSRLNDGINASAKLVIFTRTGTGVARLGMGDEALLSLVQAGAAAATRKAGLDASFSSHIAPSAVSTLQLRSIGSSADVALRLSSFIVGKQQLPRERVLLVLADMSEVTAQQVNCARQQVDEAISRAAISYGPAFSPPLVLVLAHCPPEVMSSTFPYHAVPVGGWDFVFCDAVSLLDGSGAASSASTDPRRWVAAAFGLVRQPSAAEARAEFSGPFDEALSKVRRRSAIR